MNIFSELTDAALRRVYKFVLKRTLGNYLLNELLLEQLEVSSRDGFIKLVDLEFDTEAVSKELVGFPFELVNLSVNSLEAHISYFNILTESCKFQAEDVEVVLKPKFFSLSSDNSSRCEEEPSTMNTASAEKTEEDLLSAEGEKGLKFIAHWIEAILTRLRITVNNINVKIQNQSGSAEICIRLSTIEYLNGSVSDGALDVSSVLFSNSMMNDSMMKSKFFSKTTKELRCNGFDVTMKLLSVQDFREVTVTKCTESISVKLTIDNDGKINQVATSIDINIPTLQINLDAELIGLIGSFLPSSTQNSNLANYTRNGNRSVFKYQGKERDFSVLEEKIQEVYTTLYSEFEKPSTFQSIEEYESDGEFPSDANISDDEYFDAQPIPSNMFQTKYFSTEAVARKQAQNRFSARIFCSSFEITISSLRNADLHQLKFIFEDFIYSMDCQSHKLSIMKCTLFQVTSNVYQRILWFEKAESDTIFACPDIALEISPSVSESNSPRASVTLEHVKIDFDFLTLMYWSTWANMCLSTLNDSKSSSSIIVSFACSQIEILVDLTGTVEASKIFDYIFLSSLWNKWETTPHSNALSALFIVGNGISITYDTSDSSLSSKISVKDLDLGIQIKLNEIGKRTSLFHCSSDSASTIDLSATRNANKELALNLFLPSAHVALTDYEFGLFMYIIECVSIAIGRNNSEKGQDSRLSFSIQINNISLLFGHEGDECPVSCLNSLKFNDPIINLAIQHILQTISPVAIINKNLFLSEQRYLCCFGQSAVLKVTLDDQLINFTFSCSQFILKEYYNEAIARMDQSILSVCGREIVCTPSDQKVPISFSLMIHVNDENSNFSSDVKLSLSFAGITLKLYPDSPTLLVLPSFFIPTTLYGLKERFLVGAYNLAETAAIEDTRVALLSLLRKMKRDHIKEKLKIPTETVRLFIELKDSVFVLPLRQKSITLLATHFAVSITLLSNVNTFSIKISSELLKSNYCENNLLMFSDIFGLDHVSVLVTILSNPAETSLIDAVFGKLNLNFSVEFLLVLTDFLNNWVAEFQETSRKYIERPKILELYEEEGMEGVAISEEETPAFLIDVDDIPSELPANSPNLFSKDSVIGGKSTNEESSQMFLWQPDYGSEDDRSFESNLLSKKLVAHPQSVSEDEDQSINIQSYAGLEELPKGIEIELASQHFLPEVIETYEPGLSNAEILEINEVDTAWRDEPDHGPDADFRSDSQEFEQQASWFIEPDLVEFDTHYLNAKFPILDLKDQPFFSFFRCHIRVKGDIKISVIKDIPDPFPEKKRKVEEFKEKYGERSNLERKEQLELAIKELILEFSFSPRNTDLESVRKLSVVARVSLSCGSFILSHRIFRENLHYKVLGPWVSVNQPLDRSLPILKMTAIDFAEPETRTHHEFRIIFSSCPIRCHLTESFILFLKDLSLALIQNGDVPSSSSPSSPAYFQLMMVSRIDLKIDYHASSVNVKALHEGDYLQLLNIFPLDGLELSLQPIRLKGLNGTSTVLNSLLELWITDIYKNQLHKVITGTTPFKGISNIGQGLTGLVYMPVTEYRRKNRLAWKQITKGTTSLVKTIVGETLNVSHHVSLFLANAITDLANAGGEMKRIDQEEEGNRKKFSQPRNVSQGLEKAIQSVSREFSTAAETVIAVPIREFHRNGVTGVVSSVVQALPIAVLRPIAGIAEGFSYTALGLRNSLNPVHVADEQDLWNIEEL